MSHELPTNTSQSAQFQVHIIKMNNGFDISALELFLIHFFHNKLIPTNLICELL